MKTCKERLIKFVCEDKAHLIREATGIEYVNAEDRAEMESWSESECADIICKMKSDWAGNKGKLNDATACPWCIKEGMDCTSCGYRRRHGRCDIYCTSIYDKSTYDAITEATGSSIIDLEGMKELFENLISEAEADK